MVLIDGKATPLFWADGITQSADLEAYARTGFNTVVVRLGWRPTQDGSLVPQDLEPPRAFALAAAQRGLHVIYSLPAAPAGMERSFRVCADSDPYFTLWSTWTEGAIAALKDTPNLLGWMLPDDPRGLPFYDDKGYAKWLAANYANVEFINRQWSASFPSVNDVTVDATRSLIQRWRGPGVITGGLSQADLADRIREMNERPKTQNFAFHPASLALARYEWDAFRALLARWAETIRDVDADHLILTGRLPDYAQLLSVPSVIDVSIPDVQPGVGEADSATHNPQAVDIARRGGRFAAMPVLVTTGSNTVDRDDLPRLLPAWADAALAHGASGLVCSSWQDLQDNPPLLRSIAATLERLQHAPFAEVWTQPPVATAGIVLTPLADGFTLQMGSEALPDTRGLYGFAEDLVNGEPTDLVYSMRWGTAFGSVDYLSPDDLEDAPGLLSHYGVLLMPQALSVSPAMTDELGSYVNAGGVVVADLGLGASQMGGQVTLIPPALAQLFGLAPLTIGPQADLRTLSFNLHLMEPHPLLPTWTNQVQARQGAVLTAGDGPHGAAFVGPVTFPRLLPSAIPVALGQQLIEQLGKHPRPDSPALLQRAQLSINPVGRGFALFAPFRLWNFWRPGQTGFDAFHGDLFARSAALAQFGATSFVPDPGGDPEEEEQYPEIINFSTGIGLLNHNPARRIGGATPTALAPVALTPTAPSASKGKARRSAAPGTPPAVAPTSPATMGPSGVSGGQQITVQTSGVGNFLWHGAVNSFPNGDAVQLAAGRPAPITSPNEFESQPHLVTLYANTRAQQMTIVRLVPVRVQNTAGGPLIVNVSDYTPQAIKMTVWPNATLIALRPRAEDFQVSVADPAPVHLTIYDSTDPGGYHVAPNSHHRIFKTDLLSPADKFGHRPGTMQLVTADAQGHLDLDLTGAALVLEIRRE